MRGLIGVPAVIAGALAALVTAAVVVALVLDDSGRRPTRDQQFPAFSTELDAPDPSASPVDPELHLVEASVGRVERDDTLAEQVLFCFSRTVRSAAAPERLALLGPDVDAVVRAVAVDLAVSERRCVLARFPAGTPVGRFTVAVAGNGAAGGTDVVSVASTAPLTGRPPTTAVEDGGTAGPDLIAVRTQPTLRRLRFLYDEALDEAAPRRADAFRYYTASGSVHPASEVLSVEGDTVVVAFTEPGEDVREAVRFAAVQAAVRDRAGTRSPPAAKDVVPGQGTAAPDLVDVRRVPRSDVLWDFVFDEAVQAPVPSGFSLLAADASTSPGTATARPATDTVRVLLPGVDDVADDQVLAAAAEGAVRGLGSGGARSTLGVARLGSFVAEPGRTTGPDLLEARLDARTGTLQLLFDEPLDDDAPVNPSAVQLVLPDGRILAARTFVQVTGARAVLWVDSTVAEAAARVVVARGAVRGRAGEPSAPGSRPPVR